MRKLVGTVPAVVIAVLLLSACAGDPAPMPTPEPPPPPASEPTTPADPVTTPEFAQPADCQEMLPATRLAVFEQHGLELLGGPGGRYGGDYLIDDTPEEAVGGLTCIWGDDDVPESTITISVAPLDATTRPAVISDLLSQGLIEGRLSDATSFSQLGDTMSSPAVLNLVRDESWISVIEALGGEAFFEEALAIAAEVYHEVYGLS